MKKILNLVAVVAIAAFAAACVGGPRAQMQPGYGVDVSVHGGGHHHGHPHHGHAQTPPVIHPDYAQVSSGYGRRGHGSCRPGTTWDHSARACAHGRVYLDGPSNYDVKPEQARCTPGQTRLIWVTGPNGSRRQVHQTCNI
jgi:hypothetical protein